MKLQIFLILLLMFAGVFISCNSNRNYTEKKLSPETITNRYRVMFYNVENLFDTENDPEKRDDEFTPEGQRYWTNYRYREKLNNIYRVIVAVGEWDLPKLVGLCEVENRKVLEDLVRNTPLYKTDYKIIHHESPDARGIDVALLYRENYFTPISHRPIRVKWPTNIGSGTTRDVLYAWGTTDSNDTLHVFVNHWPSRWGGQMETEEKRMHIAKLVKQQTDSILKIHPTANIIIMGDLNDHPTDRSILEVLKAETSFDKISNKKLYNLSYYLETVKKQGTHKYDGKWGILDQIIVSGGMLDTTSSIYTSPELANVFMADFLLEKDEKYTGKRVYRTYIGFKYHGGYSDHLPTYVDLKIKQ